MQTTVKCKYRKRGGGLDGASHSSQTGSSSTNSSPLFDTHLAVGVVALTNGTGVYKFFACQLTLYSVHMVHGQWNYVRNSDSGRLNE